jgi:gliding motility-associated-like protein
MRASLFFLGWLTTLACFANTPNSIRFVRNDGQWPSDIRFRADLPSGYLFVKTTGLHYVFYDLGTAPHGRGFTTSTASRTASPIPVRTHGVEVVFENANTSPTVLTSQETSEKRHFFLGQDATRWKNNVPAFGEITLKDLYPGIDLRLFTYGSSFKYEFLVAPQADVSLIKLRYEGAETLSLEQGNLVVKTSLNTFKELKPYCFQEIASKETEVPAAFQLNGSVLSFGFPKGYEHSSKLTIDPVLIFSTFSGLLGDNWGHTATYDNNGNLYSGGTVNNSLLPTRGEGQQDLAGWDIAILKFNPDGSRLISVTYLGGQFTEVPHSLIVNAKNELLIFGTTSSANFPVSASAFDRSFNGGTNLVGVSGMSYPAGSDLFITKLNATADTLLASTYVGGSSNDGINLTRNSLNIRNYGDEYRGEIVVDAQDNVYVASVTTSSNFPLVNPVTTTRSGVNDGLVLRFNPDLSVLQWSTLLGGNGFDAAYGIRASPSGAVYVCGSTTSNNLGTRPGAFKAQISGLEDGFVAKYVADKLQQITYLGANGADGAQLLDLDKDENVHVIGLTEGGYPVSAGVYQNAGSAQYIHALDKELSRTVFSTVIGSRRGTLDIIPTAFLVNECGNIYLSGWGGKINDDFGSNFTNRSSTTGLPTTPDAIRTTTDGSNFYIMILEKGAKSLLYATFFGSTNTEAGDHVDGGTCRFDKRGFIYHAACACNRQTSPSNFTASPTAWSRSNPSYNCNNVAFKIDIDVLKVSFDVFEGSKKDVVEGCAPLTLRFVNTSIGGRTFEWDLGGLQKSTSPGEVSYTFEKGGEYTIVLKGTNPLTCNREEIARRTIKVTPTDFKISPDQKICVGASFQLSASGAVSYSWSPGASLDKTNIPNPVATPTTDTQYKVELVDGNGCKTTKTVNVGFDKTFQPQFEVIKEFECSKPVAILINNKTTGADRFIWAMGNGDTVRVASPPPFVYKTPGSYAITVTAFKGECKLTETKPVEIEPPLEVTNVITPNGDGLNDTFVTGTNGVKLEVYDRWGKLIYRNENYLNDWGKGVTHGTYYFLITTVSGAKCKGWLEILE